MSTTGTYILCQGVCIVPFHAESIFHHFDASEKIDLHIFEGASLALEEGNSRLDGESRLRDNLDCFGRHTRISARSISHSFRSRS